MRQWRPEPLMRVGGVFIALVCLGTATGVVYMGFISTNPANQVSVRAAVLGSIVLLAMSAVGLAYTFRYRIVLADDMLIVVNIVTERFPIGHVASAKPSRIGIVFTMYGGETCIAYAVETADLAQSLKLRTRADEVIDAVMKAAWQGHT